MRKTRIGAAFAGLAIAALALSACNSGTPGATSPTDGATGGEEATALWEVATDVSLTGSPTYDAMVARDGVVVGVKND